jgi:hypothetical protein
MSQKVQVLFVDDLDEGPADETVQFALDGTTYEIDLSTRHADELRDALKDYIQHARKVGSAPRRSTRKPSSIDTVAVRA